MNLYLNMWLRHSHLWIISCEMGWKKSFYDSRAIQFPQTGSCEWEWKQFLKNIHNSHQWIAWWSKCLCDVTWCDIEWIIAKTIPLGIEFFIVASKKRHHATLICRHECANGIFFFYYYCVTNCYRIPAKSTIF